MKWMPAYPFVRLIRNHQSVARNSSGRRWKNWANQISWPNRWLCGCNSCRVMPMLHVPSGVVGGVVGGVGGSVGCSGVVGGGGRGLAGCVGAGLTAVRSGAGLTASWCGANRCPSWCGAVSLWLPMPPSPGAGHLGHLPQKRARSPRSPGACPSNFPPKTNTRQNLSNQRRVKDKTAHLREHRQTVL